MNRRTSALTFAMLLLFSSLGALNTAASDSDSPNVRDSASFPVTIDGLFDDWESIPVVYADPAGDGTDEDFIMLKIANDNDFMFFSIEFHDGEQMMQNWNDIHLYLDTDADVNTGLPVHGIGAELDWCFGCRSGYYYIMDGIIEIYQNDLTLRIAPTITGERFEIAISRSSAILTMDGTQEPTTIKIVLQGGGAAPDILPDEPGGIEYEFDSTPVPSPEIITLEKNEMEHLRILSYNVRQNGLFDPERQAEFERIIKALEPDIMGFQEAYDDNDTNDVNDIEALFEDWFPGVNWHVSSEWNGNFVVSRYPILHQGHHSWRSMGVLLDTEEDLGTPLFFINSHFSCCDANDNRQEQVDELMSFVRDLKNGLGPFTLEYGTPIVHVGDFNLVGYRQQLTTLTDGDIVDEASYGIDFLPDWDDSPLTDLFSRQTHIRMGYTWRSDNSEYNPGKLDYILYTDSVLEPVKHFVLNTLAMSEEDLSFYNLNSEDTKIASDHLPRVMDIAEDSEEPTWVWPDSEVPSASSTIRVLIVFPDEGAEELRAYGEGESLTGQTTIDGYVSEVFNSTNLNYARSGIDVTFDIIETMAINFSHLGADWKAKIPGAMMNPGSSWWYAEYQAELEALRDATAADVVMYWRISGDGGASASGATPFDSEHADKTFVHLIKWHMNPRVVSHELGHLLGGAHHVGLQAVANMSYDGGDFELREIRSIETSQVSSLGYGSALYLWLFSDANATVSGSIPCGYGSEHICTFAEPTPVGDENHSNVDQMLGGASISGHRDGTEYPARADEVISGSSGLEIIDLIEQSASIAASWTASVAVHDEYGSDLLADQNLGVRAQIDQHLGDGNGWVSLPEVANFSALVASARNWTDASTGGCCSLDHTAFEAAGGTTVEVFLAVGPVARNMSWGWSETAVLVGQTDGRSTRLLDLPRSGGLIEEVPLTITLPTPWEYRYSAMEDIIEGMPGEFVVNRSAAPVASNIRISLGENEPPGAYGNRLNGGSSSISRDQPTTFEGQCRDSGIETPELKWDVSDNGTIIWTSTEPWISVTPADFNFSHGEVVSVKLTCRDSFSATNIWYDNVVVDAISPTWEASFTGLPPTEDPFAIDASDGIIEIGSEDILEINISALDDSGFDTTIEVTSNRTSEWRHVDWNEMLAQSRFPQGDKVNGLHLDVDSRHEAKPLTTYSLNMTATDESGNTVQHNWTILVLDGAGPQILPNIYSNGTLIAAEHPARAGAILTVNLTDSYDDLDSILDTRWTFILNQEPIFENKSWTAIEYFDLPPLEAGSHWFIFMAWDSKDNLNLLSFSVAVQPAPGVDIRVWNVSYFGAPIVGETLSVHAIVQNIGGDAATGRLCSGEICSQLVNIPWATATGPGVVGVDLEVPLERAGELQLRFEWGSSQLNEEGQIDIDSNIIVNPNSGPLNIVILVFVVLAGLAWGAHRLWGSERFD